MIEKSNKHLINECKRIEDDCMYNAEAHHAIASTSERLGFWVKFIPAAVAAGSGAAMLSGFPQWVGWFAIISGVIFALASILGPDKKANDQTKVAKDYTVLKHDARALYQTFSHEMSESEFHIAVRLLRQRYNDLVNQPPKTNDKALQKAREKIRAGTHRPNFTERQSCSPAQDVTPEEREN